MADLSISFLEHFKELNDPRTNNHNKRHSLTDILVLTILAVICGAESWVEVEEFRESKREWLHTFLELPNGIPSHDTIGDLFARLEPNELQNSFLSWVSSLVQITDGEIVAIDGKTLRGSYDSGKSRGPIHMVSAWAHQNNVVLGQVKTHEKSNEITAIPELLKMLDIKGCTVTIDAMGCQKKIAQEIIDKEAHYVLALKGNQGIPHMVVENFFENALETGFNGINHNSYEEVNDDHGRVEVRKYWMTSELSWLYDRNMWPGLTSVGMVQSMRIVGKKTSVENRFYLTSLCCDAKKFGRAVRSHWSIENSLHWCLDVGFHEDDCRVRTGNAAENFGIIRHIALNLLKKETKSKIGIQAKRKKSGWSNQYLLKVLSGT